MALEERVALKAAGTNGATTEFNAGDFVLEALDWGTPPIRDEWVQSADSSGSRPQRGLLKDNREPVMRLRFADKQVDMDTVLAKLTALEAVLESAERVAADGIHDLAVDPVRFLTTPAKSTASSILPVYSGHIEELPKLVSGDDAGWFLQQPVFTVRTVADPCFIDAKVSELTAEVQTGDPFAQIINVPAAGGSARPLIYTKIEEQEAIARNQLIVGMESPATTDPLIIPAGSLDRTGYSGSLTSTQDLLRTNYIPDPGFEQVGANWGEAWGNATSAADTTTPPFEGAKCGSVIGGTTANGSGRSHTTAVGTAKQGENWVGFYRVRAPSPAEVGRTVQLVLREATSAGAQIAGQATTVQVVLTSDWQEILVTRRLAHATVDRVILTIMTTITTAFTFAVDTAMLQKMELPVLREVGSEVRDTFSNNSNGAPGNADTGQPYTHFDNGATNAALRVIDGYLTNTSTVAASATGFVQTQLDGNVQRIGARFAFSAGGNTGAIALIVPQQSIETIGVVNNGQEAAVHFVLSMTNWAFQLIENGVVTANLASGSLTANLSQDVEYETEVLLDGNRAYIRLPDGSMRVVTDPRIATYLGPYAVWEVAQTTNAATQAKARFAEVWASDEPTGRDQLLGPFFPTAAQLSAGTAVWEGTAYASSSKLLSVVERVSVTSATDWVAACTTGSLPHAQSYRVFALAAQGNGKIRFRYGVEGDAQDLNPVAEVPLTLYRDIDLGSITVDRPAGGTWLGVIEVMGTVSFAGLLILPTDVWAMAETDPGSSSLGTRQVEGNLTGSGTLAGHSLTQPAAQTWSLVSGTWTKVTGAVQRTAISESSRAIALAGTSNYAGVAVFCDVTAMQNSTPDITSEIGIVLRYVDANNYAAFRLKRLSNDGAWYLGLVLRIGGQDINAPSGVSGYSAIKNPGPIYFYGVNPGLFWVKLGLAIDAQGRWQIYFLSPSSDYLGVDNGKDPVLIVSGIHPALAAGGALATGRVGLLDMWTQSNANTRQFRNFRAYGNPISTSPILPALKSIEFTESGMVRVDGANRARINHRGGILTPEPDQASRLVVVTRRFAGLADIVANGKTDNQKVTVTARKRYVQVPG